MMKLNKLREASKISQIIQLLIARSFKSFESPFFSFGSSAIEYSKLINSIETTAMSNE